MIVLGWPGIGKTHLWSQQRFVSIPAKGDKPAHKRVVAPPGGLGYIDSDSSKYSWLSPGVRHPDFPNNYVDHLQKVAQHRVPSVILASTHKVVRDELERRKQRVLVILPSKTDKEVYLKRYAARGSDAAFIKMMDENWDAWYEDCSFGWGMKYILQPGGYLSSVDMNEICGGLQKLWDTPIRELAEMIQASTPTAEEPTDEISGFGATVLGTTGKL